MTDLSSPDLLMGKGIVGGGYSRRSYGNGNSYKNRYNDKYNNNNKNNNKNRYNVYRGGFFFDATATPSNATITQTSLGDEYKCYSCVKVSPVPAPTQIVEAKVQPSNIVSSPSSEPPRLPDAQIGGSANVRVIYKKKLNELSVEKLRKMAKERGITITKKKDGKTVYVKKATIIQKLCDFKHGKQ